MLAWFIRTGTAGLAWCTRVGEEWDVFLNVLFLNGYPGESISRHAAGGARDGKRGWCLLCRWFSLTVETDHCAKTLLGEALKTGVAFRAGFQLLFVALAIGAFWKWVI